MSEEKNKLHCRVQNRHLNLNYYFMMMMMILTVSSPIMINFTSKLSVSLIHFNLTHKTSL